MSLADRLKNARKEKDLSQQELAELSNVHYSNIGRYERGDAKPSAEVLKKIADTLDTTVDFLISGDIDEKQLLHSMMQNYCNNSGQ